LFAGWNLSLEDAASPDLAAIAYSDGVARGKIFDVIWSGERQ